MKNKTKYMTIVGVLILVGFSTTLFAKDAKVQKKEDAVAQVAPVQKEADAVDMAFGTSALKDMKPVQKKDGECLSFEASFSDPLSNKPLARLDIENHFINLLNAFLEVTKISDEKYRFALTAKTDEGCPKLEDESRLTISTYSVKDESNINQQAQPAEVTFKAEKKAEKAIALKKVE